VTGEEDRSLLERIKEILNTPLPGTADAQGDISGGDQQDRPRETPTQTGHPSPPAPASQGSKTPDVAEDDLDEQWWKQDWAAFRTHQAIERQGLEQKQTGDLAEFTAYQEAEKHRFEAHQQQELDAFRQQQQWRMNAWKQTLAANPGSRPPPRPWGMPAPPGMMPPGAPTMGGPFPGPMGPPPWTQPPGPRRRR